MRNLVALYYFVLTSPNCAETFAGIEWVPGMGLGPETSLSKGRVFALRAMHKEIETCSTSFFYLCF